MKKNKYEVKQSNTSLYLMFGMLTMVVLYLAYVFYQINWVFYILSSIFIVCITSEGKPLAALIMYLLVSGLSLVLMPIPYALPYIMVFGHYGLAKYFLEKIRDKIVSFVAKILYFNAFCALTYFLIIIQEINLLHEVVDENNEDIGYQPSMDINKMNVALLLDRLDTHGSEDFKIDKDKEFSEQWEVLMNAREEYYKSASHVLLKDL